MWSLGVRLPGRRVYLGESDGVRALFCEGRRIEQRTELSAGSELAVEATDRDPNWPAVVISFVGLTILIMTGWAVFSFVLVPTAVTCLLASFWGRRVFFVAIRSGSEPAWRLVVTPIEFIELGKLVESTRKESESNAV